MEKVVHRVPMKGAPRDRAYWMSRPVQERFAAVEFLRQQAHAETADAQQGLQSVCRVTQLKRG
jgi:hypothetical protein